MDCFFRGYLMRKDKSLIKSLVKDTIEFLHERGIHTFIVKSGQEARNFILYHVGVETIVLLQREKAVDLLQLEKSIIEIGGTLDNSDVDMKNKRTQNSIEKVQVYGTDYFLNNPNAITFKKKSPVLDNEGRVKTILVIWMDDKEIHNIIHKLKEESLGENLEKIKLKKIKKNYNDISIIFIDEKQ